MPSPVSICSIHDPLASAAFARRLPIAVLTEALENRTPSEQRTLIGESLYPLVELLVPVFAAKITVMLLELDRTLIFKLIESPEALKEKVHEAIDVLFKSDFPQQMKLDEEENKEFQTAMLLSKY